MLDENFTLIEIGLEQEFKIKEILNLKDLLEKQQLT